MKTSLVVTVLNEENTINDFIESLLLQSELPGQLIIVDGGSSDQTVANIKYQILNIKKGNKFRNLKFQFFIKTGNRSKGRNYGIKKALNEIILSTDVGCILDRDWVRNVSKPFSDPSVDVVAGYYRGKGITLFEKCVIPYVLVMPDRVKADLFLPASRSMAFKKSVWKNIGGWPEEFSHNEDYVFAHKLKKLGAKIILNKEAVVYWLPRKNIKEAFIMFFRFAYGDVQAGIIRTKVMVLLVRYAFFLGMIGYAIVNKSVEVLIISVGFVLLYILWSIIKNYRYVKKIGALYMLPTLQLLSDLSVISGTVAGFFRLRIFSVIFIMYITLINLLSTVNIL